MKKIYSLVILLVLLLFNSKVYALDNKVYVDLNNYTYGIESYDSIKRYDKIDDFLVDYNNNNLPSIYITSFLFDGVGSVLSPDLDDYIADGKISTLKIDVLNINTIGDIVLTGEVSGMMIGVNTNNVKGNINLILNNLILDTDSKKAPAIYVYNKDINYIDCKVTIKTMANTTNILEGGKLKKVSLMPSDELSNYSSYYNNDINNYKDYYGIYTKDEISNILFATVKADNEDLMDNDPYYFYKASGAISSDIDLYFEGEGYLKVTSKNKEGIETKGNLTLSGKTGDYEVHSLDDCLNTTTSNSVTNARNDIVIDVNTLLAVVGDGDEGDAIDSNGSLTINGGTIYAFAHETSQDSGLDSENGIVINGGTIISTGNMSDSISNDSKQDYIFINLNNIQSGDLIVIKNELDEIITAFKTNKAISTLLYSSDSINYESLKVYKGGVIDGEEVNGLYTKINSYENGSEISYSLVNNFNNFNKKNIINSNSNSNSLLIVIITSVVIFISLMIYALKKGIFEDEV